MKKILHFTLAAALILALLSMTAMADSSVSTRSQLVKYLTTFSVSQPSTISFEYTGELKDSIADSSWMASVLNDAGIFSAGWSYGGGKCTFESIQYMPPHSVCASEEEVLSVLRGAASGEVAFRVPQTLFDRLSANGFQRLYDLESQAGFRESRLSYYSSCCLITISEIVFAENLAFVDTFEEFKECLQNKTLALENNFVIHCSYDLFELLTDDECALLNEVETNCGIYQSNMHYSNSKRTFDYADIEYYPGFYVARSVKLGQAEQLTGKMLTLYQTARNILEEVGAANYSDRIELQFALQEAILYRTEYYKGYSGGDHDTSIGALINGRCECDGYADAFYMLADLSGFNVRFQSGVDLDDNNGHLWNIIEHNGQWYFTDLTWCDSTNNHIHHMYSNIGHDIASECYIWNVQAALVPLASETSGDYHYCLLNNIFYEDIEEAALYVTEQLRSGSTEVEVLITRPADQSASTFVDHFCSRITVSYQVSYVHTDSLVSMVFQSW